MDPFSDGIGLKQDEVVGRTQINHRTIIARSGDDRIVGRERLGELLDEFEFVHEMLGRLRAAERGTW